jgi:hypothetical protein
MEGINRMTEQVPLVRQIEMVFRVITEELTHLSSGTIYLQVRNNEIGKFGVRHLPVESKDGRMRDLGSGLTEQQVSTLKDMALESLQLKKQWTHGEMVFDFTTRNNLLCVSVTFESSYNMANHFMKPSSWRQHSKSQRLEK